MKILAVLALLVIVAVACLLFYQGKKSVDIAAPQISGGKLPPCGPKPNCVCSEQSPSGEHHIAAIALNSHSIDSIAQAVDDLGGVVTSRNTDTLQATFTSGIFGFTDDVMVRLDGDNIHVRSSSRVGHGDLGANRKRVERLRKSLS